MLVGTCFEDADRRRQLGIRIQERPADVSVHEALWASLATLFMGDQRQGNLVNRTSSVRQ